MRLSLFAWRIEEMKINCKRTVLKMLQLASVIVSATCPSRLFVQNLSQEQFFPGSVALDQMSDELHGIPAGEYRCCQVPLTINQQNRSDNETPWNPDHVQPEACRIAMPHSPVFNRLGYFPIAYRHCNGSSLLSVVLGGGAIRPSLYRRRTHRAC